MTEPRRLDSGQRVAEVKMGGSLGNCWPQVFVS